MPDPTRMAKRKLPFVVAALSSLAYLPVLADDADGVAQYTAQYEVRYKGRRVAQAEFNVAADSAGTYVFTSTTEGRGLLGRLAAPNPAVERSRFSVTNGRIVPMSFEFVDGSRKGEDNFSVAFEADSSEIQITGATGSSTLPLEIDLLDRGSLQVALMRDLAACSAPGPYRYVDDDGVKTYEYQQLEDDAAETGIGTIPTVRFMQQRAASSRRTILWLASEYSFVPVKIEQVRDGEIETVYSLESLSGVPRSASDCSGFG